MTTPMINPVDLVIVIDTSGSMKMEAGELSAAAEKAIADAKSSCPSNLRVVWLGLEGTWENTKFDRKLSDYLVNTNKVDESTLQIRRSKRTGWDEQEDGASAIEDIANHFDWRSDAARAILYLGDEALDGSSSTVNEEATSRVIEAAKANHLVVHTYFGDSGHENKEDLQGEYARVSQATKGRAFTKEDALDGFADLLRTVICVTQEVTPVDPLPQHPKPERNCIDLVVAIDTSGSMADKSGVCQVVEREVEGARSEGSNDLRVVWLGLEGTLEGTECKRTVRSYLIKECGVDEEAIRGRKLTSSTGSGPQEDGARTIEDLACHFDWRSGSARNILYISDEGLDGGGTRVTRRAVAAADRACEVAQQNQVVVHTCFVGDTSTDTAGLQEEYERVAKATGGRAFIGQDTLTALSSVLIFADSATGEPAPSAVPQDEHENPFTDLAEWLQGILGQSAQFNSNFQLKSGNSFNIVNKLDVEQLQTYTESQTVLSEIELELEELQSSVSQIMSSSRQVHGTHSLIRRGENAFREWLASIETAVQQREEVQNSLHELCLELRATLARAQDAHQLFLTERDELWSRWTALQHGELSESVKMLLKKEREAKEAAQAEVRLLREEVETLKRQLTRAQQTLESVDVTAMRKLEKELHVKLREQRTFQAELQGINQRIQARMVDYESRLEHWRKSESAWQKNLHQIQEELRMEREKAEALRRENALLLKQAKAESEWQDRVKKLGTQFMSKQVIEAQYIHKNQVRQLLKVVLDSFAKQIHELERGAEQHEDALESRLAWTVRLNKTLDNLSQQLYHLEGIPVELISETTQTILTTESWEKQTVSASASADVSELK